MAAAMSELGIEAGDRVAIILPNRPEWIVSLLACAKLGATVVPVNPRLNYHELKYQLRHAEVSAAVTAFVMVSSPPLPLGSLASVHAAPSLQLELISQSAGSQLLVGCTVKVTMPLMLGVKA